ncbi:hypothetical protein PPL_06472 [Heterostelium album PN500]|uniref:Uncharacterized protein n=1 Tax=Heterostelium pallidum (strain ATCC 26659 / Pp 5 / PN500) TaxID=670386 RepID=D3BD91_HETP5|nr:hypothetical protein PPL_06472 [Heterostelium album PN500]EFA80883.1 hypothetical protein PPL_06472 [Heterostelium album PN500]|eukprot:XP_020433002.1 hypothetical protein PPL_06472 [Heterostelium album PN500]
MSVVGEKIIYNTKTYCPKCTLVDRKGLVLTDAQVVSKSDNKVYLKSICSRHPSHYTLYCSSLDFFNRISSYSFELNDKKQSQDIEDLYQKYSNGTNNSNNNGSNATVQQSLIIELNIFQNNIFLNDDQILNNIKQFQSMYQKNRKFALKVMAKGSNDVQTINDKVIYIASLLVGYPILVEVTVERLNLLGNLANSCFLLGKVYPALKYFLKQGDEELVHWYTGSDHDCTGTKVCQSHPDSAVAEIQERIDQNHHIVIGAATQRDCFITAKEDGHTEQSVDVDHFSHYSIVSNSGRCRIA